MKKTLLSYTVALTLCFGLASCEQSKKETDGTEVAEEQNEEKMTTDEGEDAADFAVEAADGSMLEIEASKLALQKATDQSVKTFAQKMITDHTKASTELKSIASQKNITLPTTMSDEHQKVLDKLTKESGTEFDKEYMEAMDKAHEKDVKLFEDATKEDDLDPALKTFASKTLPIIRMHAQMADAKEEMTEDMHDGKNNHTMSGNRKDDNDVDTITFQKKKD
jgi:putative membrane protein